MKRSLYHKWRTLFFVFLCSMAFISVSALAQQDDAQRISLDGELQIHTSKSRSADGNLTDGEEATYLSFVANDTITIKLGKEMQGLYLQWHMLPIAYEVEWKSEEGKRIEQEKRRPFAVNEYVTIPEGAKEFTLRFSGKTELSDISAYGDGNLPESLQQWEMPKTQPAIMLLCGYPGDELLYFGGLVPYCVNQGIPFTVAYMSSYDRVRQEECLSALWSLGVHQAPVFLERGTKHNKDVSYLLLNWKKTPSIGVVRNMLIEYEPRVVISFGEEGITERLYAYRDSFRKQRCFGEAQTAATGQIVEEAVKAAAKIKNGFRIDKLFAVTDTPGATFLDLSEPLGYYHDKTGNEVAAEAYETYYRSMSTFHYSVKTELRGDLIRGSAEGNTIRDLLSGISYEPDHEPVPTATPVPTVTSAPTETPAPTATIMPTEMPRMTPVQTVVPTGAEMEKTPFPTMLVPMACVSLAAFVFALTVLRKRLKHGIWIALLAILFVTFLVFAGVVMARMLHFWAEPGLEDTVAEELYFQEPERQTVPHPTMVPTPITGEAEGNLQDETAIEQGKTEEPAVSRYEEHFLHSDTEEEVITVDVENGFWSYQSHDFAVFIKRYQETGGKYTQEEQPLVWFVADIYMREGVDAFRSPFSDEGRSGRTTVMPWQFSRTYKSILFVNGDNMLNMDVELKGTIIRDGHVYSATNKAADVLAWNRRSQRFDYYEKSGYTAQQLMEAGYQDTFSFGPIVLLDGDICTEACKASNVHMLNPRCGVGTAEDGHTVAIVVDGRRPRYSVGVDLLTYAQMFLDYGCTDAYNLDGGVSSCMYFMGEQLNSHGNKKDFSQQRHMPDGLTFGYSELVPTVNDPIYNDGTDRNAVEADYH